MWQPQWEYFRRWGWRVVVPDLRGYGESSVTPGVVPLNIFACDFQRLLAHLGISRTVVAGLSMGGQIVMELYHAYPALFRAMILADTFAAAETPAGKLQHNAAADRLVREGMGPYADEVLPRMITPQNIVEQPRVAGQVLHMMRTTSPAGAAAALRGRAERRDFREMLTRVEVPALVIVGREDAFTSVRDAEDMHKRISGSHLAVIDRAGHMPNLEQPERFNQVVNGFLASLPA